MLSPEFDRDSNINNWRGFTPEKISRISAVRETLASQEEPISTFPFTEEELSVIVNMFSDDELGRKIKGYIDNGSKCERSADCKNLAIASVNFAFIVTDNLSEGGIGIRDSLLFCIGHIQDGYKRIERDISTKHIYYQLGINGFTVNFLMDEYHKT